MWLCRMENGEHISQNQQFRHTHTALQDGFVSSGEVFYQLLACWASAVPLRAAPELVLVFPTWGSSRDCKAAWQHKSCCHVKARRIKWIKHGKCPREEGCGGQPGEAGTRRSPHSSPSAISSRFFSTLPHCCDPQSSAMDRGWDLQGLWGLDGWDEGGS